MRIITVRGNVLTLCAAAALISGCSGTQPQVAPLAPAPGVSRFAPPVNSAATEKTLYSFTNDKNGGAAPQANMINVGGTFYGTTFTGGTGSCNLLINGCGTVFSMTTAGKETLLHDFQGGTTDGNLVSGGLLNISGTLYGTAEFGGTGASPECRSGCGIVYSIKGSSSGSFAVLYSFGGNTAKDGSIPTTGLINVNGTMYGTTYGGGANSAGTIFSITTAGKETDLYDFGGGSSDGNAPDSDLVNVKGTLYGTTSEGGSGTACQYGCGTVFSYKPGGSEKLLHSFTGSPSDGSRPELAALIDVSGTLYGTTRYGGKNDAGTLFSIASSGKETVLYSFGANKTDAQSPDAKLYYQKGVIYGTSSSGGSGFNGAIFTYTVKTKAESVLYRFAGGPKDGGVPRAGLISVGGTLYGTTSTGGSASSGTMFSFKP